MKETTAWKKLEEYFSKKSMMEILGVDRDENAHSKFLAWLFEKPEALSLLLAFIKSENKKDKVPIIENDSKIVSITEDFFIDNNEKRRVDILIKVYPKENELPYYIVIENKVYSDEHTNQLCAYYNYYSQKYNDRVLFLFLTLPEQLRLPKQKATKSDCKEFIPITYQDIMSNVLDKMDKDEMMQDYVKCLGLSYWQERNVMAYSKDFSNLLNAFWKDNMGLIKRFSKVDECYTEELKEIWSKHSVFLKTIIKVLAEMPRDMCYDINDDDYNCIYSLNEVVNGKDFTHYIIFESNGVESKPLGKNELIFALVSKYIEKNQTTFEQLQRVFPETWRMRPNSKSGTLTNQIVINKKRYDEDIKEMSKNDWKELEAMNGVYVLQTLWDGKELMRRVIEKVKEIEELKDLTIIEKDDISSLQSRLKNKLFDANKKSSHFN